MTTDAPQQLGRTLYSCDHDGISAFCINCIVGDIPRGGFRSELARVALVDMKRLVELRMAADGTEWNETWPTILDDRLRDDLRHADPRRREAATRVRDTIGDFLNYRRLERHSQRHRADLARKLAAIVRRTRERLATIAREGSEPELVPPTN